MQFNNSLFMNFILKTILRIGNYLQNLALKIYIFIFGRPAMQKYNDKFLTFVLHARGYDNYYNEKRTGEHQFLNNLKNTNPKICIDIGANIGDYSKYLLETTNASVYAFEPLPEIFNKLNNLTKNYPNRFFPINMVVGEINSELELNFDYDNSTLASFSSSVNEIDYVGAVNKNKLLVPVITLDNFITQNFENTAVEIDLIKIDTEGFEYEVLIGA